MSRSNQQRTALEERQRVDQAMAIIDAAKRKALTQRMEYGKFLDWKVKMQHRERKQREEEEELLRTRIDARLRAVLEDHRKRRKEELARWKSYSTAKVRRASPIARIIDDFVPQQGSQSGAHNTGASQRAEPPPRSAPPRGSLKKKEIKSRHVIAYEPHLGPGPRPAALAAPKPVRDEPSNKEEEAVPQTETDFLELLQAIPEVSTSTHSASRTATESLTVAQLESLRRIEGLRKRTANKTAVLASMFQTAKSRRLYSTARMLADPPADFLMGNDLMRYIPADIMLEVETGGSAPAAAAATPSPDGDAFFITEANQIAERNIDISQDVRQKHHTDAPKVGPHHRTSKWKPYDPHAWISVPNAKISQLAALHAVARNREEEAATLEWYKKCCEPITRPPRRTETHLHDVAWSRVTKHVLPPLGSARLTQQLP